MNITITGQQAFDGLTRIVNDFPHRIGTLSAGTGCAYAVATESGLVASCIVGEFFARMGLLGLLVNDPFDAYFNQYDRGEFIRQDGPVCESLWYNLETAGVNVTEEARRLFAEVQTRQDDGQAWALCLEDAAKTIRDEDVARIMATLDSNVWANTATHIREHADAVAAGTFREESPLADWERELLSGE